MSKKWRFTIDNRGAGPWRSSKLMAQNDAVLEGLAIWSDDGLILNDSLGADIEMSEENQKTDD